MATTPWEMFGEGRPIQKKTHEHCKTPGCFEPAVFFPCSFAPNVGFCKKHGFKLIVATVNKALSEEDE